MALARSHHVRCLLFAAAGLVAASATAQRELTDIPEPNPAKELEAMELAPACEVQLFAADPMIRKPIQMNFDSRGRLWVASSSVYPQIEPGQKASDQIVVLEDRDGDGVAEQSTVFADGLLIPTGVVPDHDPSGAYVAASTELLYLKDTDGDGKADQRRVVLSGFGTEDTHHLLHTLRWGPDGCLYMNQSIYIHSHIETPHGTKHLEGGGIWRYRPETGELEVFCRGFVNPWGHVFDSQGQSFATDGAYFEGINYVFPESVFVTSPGATRWLGGLNPGSPKHCGLEVLSGTHIPDDWRGDFVTNDFRSHRVCRFTVRPAESGYSSLQQPELIRTQHVAFRPIDVRMGPDGAIYVADWYNPIIQHGEVDFRDPRRDQEHGRIWRISFPSRPPQARPDYAQASIPELLNLLESEAHWIRQFARQELKLRDQAAVIAAVDEWKNAASDNDARGMEAMWIHQCVNHVDAKLLGQLLTAKTSSVRAAAVRTIGYRLHQLPEARGWLKSAINDPHPQVRLEAVCALRNAEEVTAVADALAVLQHPMDKNLDFALWSLVRHHQSLWTTALANGTLSLSDNAQALAFALQAAGTSEVAGPIVQRIVSSTKDNSETRVALGRAVIPFCDAKQLQALLSWTTDLTHGLPLAQRAELLNLISAQASTRSVVPDQAADLLNAFARKPNALDEATLRDAVFQAAGLWKASPLEDLLTMVISSGRTDVPPPAAAFAALGQINSASAQQRLSEVAGNPGIDVRWRVAAIQAMAQHSLSQAADATVALLSSRTAAPWGEAAISAVLDRKGGGGALGKAIRGAKIQPDAARAALRLIRTRPGSEELAKLFQAAGALEEAAWKFTPELVADLTSAAQTSGDAQRGEAIYRRAELQCVKCHQIGPAGGLVGPNLVSLGGSAQVDYIIQSLLDPSAKLKEGFQTKIVLTAAGQVMQGLIVSENQENLTLRLADDSLKVIPQESIDEVSDGQSLMPGGLVDALTREELIDLVRFLSELGRTPEFLLSTEPVVRTLETLQYSDEANRRMNRTSVDAAATDEVIFQWRPLTSRVDGSIALEELDRFQQHRETPPTSFIRFQVEVQREGETKLELGADEGLSLWIDGRPQPIWQADKLDLAPGNHRVMLAIDRNQIQQLPAIKVRTP